MRLRYNNQYGFSIVHVFAGVVLVAVLIASVVTGFGSRDTEIQKVDVEAIVGALESELALHVSSQGICGRPVAVHNPFDGLLNKPTNYLGILDSADLQDLPAGHWAFCPQDNSVVYRPLGQIVGGRLVGSQQLITYRVRPVMVGNKIGDLELVVPSEYTYSWE